MVRLLALTIIRERMSTSRTGVAVAFVISFGAVLGAASDETAPPERLTIVAPAAPGGGWDQTARAMQQALMAGGLVKNVQVENVPGAAGTIGLARFVQASRGHAHSLLVTGLVMVGGIVAHGAPVTLGNTTPIARLTGEFEVIAVPAASPYRTFADLLAAWRASPGTVSWGGGSAGGTDELLLHLVAERVGVASRSVNYVAFAGGGEAVTSLVGGQVTAGVSGIGEFAGQIAAGALRPLAVSSAHRVDGLDAPTLREAGVDLDLSNWRGIVAPPGIAPRERDAIATLMRRLVVTDAWRSTLARNGWSDLYLDGVAFEQFVLAEQARVAGILRRIHADDESAGGPPHRFMPGPEAGPRLAAAILAGLVVCGLFRTVSSQRRRASPPALMTRAGAIPGRESDPHRFAWLAAGVAMNLLFFETIGFIPASIVLFACVARGIAGTLRASDVAVAIGVAVTLFALFTGALGVGLPPGLWFGRP